MYCLDLYLGIHKYTLGQIDPQKIGQSKYALENPNRPSPIKELFYQIDPQGNTPSVNPSNPLANPNRPSIFLWKQIDPHFFILVNRPSRSLLGPPYIKTGAKKLHWCFGLYQI